MNRVIRHMSTQKKFFSKCLETSDSELHKLIGLERKRQLENIELIASENYTSQSVIDCQKLFEMLSIIAFSEKYIDNYKDPLFIFLNLKTGKNKKTLDKLYSIIKNTLNKNLIYLSMIG